MPKGPLPLDALSRQYRRFYFLRRSLVTLDEFSGAISRLNALKTWTDRIDKDPDSEERKIWNEAIELFAIQKERFAIIRNDIGGHFQEKSAKYAFETLSPDTTGSLAIEVENDGADAKLHFALELVARILLKDMRTCDPSEAEILKYIDDIFKAVTAGWRHVVKAVVVRQYQIVELT